LGYSFNDPVSTADYTKLHDYDIRVEVYVGRYQISFTLRQRLD